MNAVKISVIIPIYNAEKYLSKAVESVLQQDSVGEIILVDDGSTDDSTNICDMYEQKDERVVVIHKKNGGLSTARNAGLRVATGTHISFLDADDFVDLDTYKEIEKVIIGNNPDIIDFGWKYINDSGEVSYNLHKLKKNQILDKDEIKDRLIPPLINLKKDEAAFIYDFAVNKIYKMDIIRQNNILFDENRRTWEDRIFVVDYLRCCSTFYSMDKCLYNYVSVPNSLSRRYDPDFFKIIIANYNIYKDKFGNQYDFNTPYVWNYWSDSIENMIYRSLGESKNREKIEQNILETLKNEQVREWFRNRTTEDVYEKKLSELIENGKTEEVLKLCQEKRKHNDLKNRCKSLKLKVEGFIKQCISK